MNRRRKREERTNKNNMGVNILWIVVGIAIISFIISYTMYSKKLSMKENKEKDIQKIASSSNNSKIINILENSEEASTSIGKSVNELENTTNEKKENKIAVNTNKIEEKKKEDTKKEKQKDTEKKIEKKEANKNEVTKNQNNENTKENKKDEKKNNVDNQPKDITFAKPVEGEIIKDYSKDNLIYSNTLEEWTTHLGIDYKAEKTDIVKSVADGKIKSIKNDPRYGLTIVIEHANGFVSSYSSLLTAEFVKVGEEVKKGQTIATVGNTARFEVADETHLHFELKKDGENVDPNIYIK